MRRGTVSGLDHFDSSNPGYNVQQLMWTQHFQTYTTLVLAGILGGLGTHLMNAEIGDGVLVGLIVIHYLILITLAVGFREPPYYMLE